MALYDEKKFKILMNDVGIIRNRLKIESSKTNAIAYFKVQKEFGSFDVYYNSTYRRAKETMTLINYPDASIGVCEMLG